MQSLAIPDRVSLHERYRTRVVSAFVLIYLFILFEGVLRKWVMPSLSSVIYFIKDPIVLYIYWCAYRFGFSRKTWCRPTLSCWSWCSSCWWPRFC